MPHTDFPMSCAEFRMPRVEFPMSRAESPVQCGEFPMSHTEFRLLLCGESFPTILSQALSLVRGLQQGGDAVDDLFGEFFFRGQRTIFGWPAG